MTPRRCYSPTHINAMQLGVFLGVFCQSEFIHKEKVNIYTPLLNIQIRTYISLGPRSTELSKFSMRDILQYN